MRMKRNHAKNKAKRTGRGSTNVETADMNQMDQLNARASSNTYNEDVYRQSVARMTEHIGESEEATAAMEYVNELLRPTSQSGQDPACMTPAMARWKVIQAEVESLKETDSKDHRAEVAARFASAYKEVVQEMFAKFHEAAEINRAMMKAGILDIAAGAPSPSDQEKPDPVDTSRNNDLEAKTPVAACEADDAKPEPSQPEIEVRSASPDKQAELELAEALHNKRQDTETLVDTCETGETELKSSEPEAEIEAPSDKQGELKLVEVVPDKRHDTKTPVDVCETLKADLESSELGVEIGASSLYKRAVSSLVEALRHKGRDTNTSVGAGETGVARLKPSKPELQARHPSLYKQERLKRTTAVREKRREVNTRSVRHQAARDKYFEARTALNQITSIGYRRKFAKHQLPGYDFELHDSVDYMQWGRLKAESEIWKAKAFRREEMQFWDALIAAAECFAEGSLAGTHQLHGTSKVLKYWYEKAWGGRDESNDYRYYHSWL